MPIVNPTAETHPERYGFRIPEMPFMGRNPKCRKLLEMEEKRSDAIGKCATEMMRLLELKDHYREAVPEALAAVLESYDSHASDAAAIGYLRKRGYHIIDKTEEY